MNKVRVRPLVLVVAAAVVACVIVALGVANGGPDAGRDLPSAFQDGASPASAELAPVLPAGASTGGPGTVSGQAVGLAPDDVLWAFAVSVPESGGGYVPLPDACVRDGLGWFTCGAAPSPVGPLYDLLVMRATEAAANEVIQFLASAPAGSGLAQIPDGMEQIGAAEIRGG